jgi:hypothetical protein
MTQHIHNAYLCVASLMGVQLDHVVRTGFTTQPTSQHGLIGFPYDLSHTTTHCESVPSLADP